LKSLKLKKALSRVLSEGHPWIFKDALEGSASTGQVVTINDHKNRFVCRGIADAGPIGVRVFTNIDEPLDTTLFENRIASAVSLRSQIILDDTTGYRLIHGEGDRLPGVVCDVYADYAVLQFDGKGILHWQDTIVDILKPILLDKNIPNLLIRSRVGQEHQVNPVLGQLPQMPILILEHGMKLLVDPLRGQKTGLFLDHRESRRRTRQMAKYLRVLNLYGYTGGFSIAAGLGQARQVDTVDISSGAIDLAQKNWELNNLDPSIHNLHVSDVRNFLQKAAGSRKEYDLIIADPPSFAPRESNVLAAKKAYEGLHCACLKRLINGGYYLAASCSSHIRADTFENTLKKGASKAHCSIQLIDRWSAPGDHPRLLSFPEGEYLKVMLIRKL
jgi:23S rRNA (cytosine1962-C5)-methyltransferase